MTCLTEGVTIEVKATFMDIPNDAKLRRQAKEMYLIQSKTEVIKGEKFTINGSAHPIEGLRKRSFKTN